VEKEVKRSIAKVSWKERSIVRNGREEVVRDEWRIERKNENEMNEQRV
jgi:hypothetical protein